MAGDPITWGRDHALVRLLTCVDAPTLLSAAMDAALPEDAQRVGALYRQHADGRLTLDASLGVSEAALRAYATMTVGWDVPVAEAVRSRVPVYSPAADFPRTLAEPAARLRGAGADYVYVSLPLLADGDCLGVLALLLPAGFAAMDGHRARLRAVATVCAHRRQRILASDGDDGDDGDDGVGDAGGDGNPGAIGGPSPARSRGASVASGSATEREPPVALATDRGRVSMLDLAMAGAGIGSFDWDFPSGRLVWDERLCRLFGIAPDAFDGRIETFFAAVLPEDRRVVEEAVAESRTTGRYHAVFRIARPDGSVRWIDAESRVVFLHGGEARGMTGIAQDRTEEIEREEERRTRRDFVLNLTRGLTAAVTTDDVVQTVIREAMPTLGARWLAVYLRQEHGPARLVGSTGFDAADARRMERLARRVHRDPLLDALRSGNPMFVESPREWTQRMPGEHFAPPAGQQAWALLPMTSAEGLVGVCTLIYDRPRSFTSDDRTVLTAAGGILGQSIARARLHDTRRRYLTELQRLLLPMRLPQTPGLEVAACYRPGSAGLEVGGDWYDVVPRSEGRVAVIIGDVQGHSVQAAGVMGQLRTSMRAYASEGHGPADLLVRGGLALEELDTDRFATCCVAEIDPRDGVLRVARAGHPYPLLLEGDGRVRELEVPGGVPLGTFEERDYPVTETALPPGGALLLYTDGLVERRGGDYADGVAALCERLAWWGGTAGSAPGAPGAPGGREGPEGPEGAGGGLEAAVQRIAEPAASRPLHDDIAAVLVRLTAAPGPAAATAARSAADTTGPTGADVCG
ncbi:SpoIIE family protein phosphatase [Streptomyces sp. DSM 42041]|uniref:SpoIIE family protein phosphatase n=1 Tax=Streptomyces hazeniae TaxID=3075538 RepID=A0ABU2NXP3_9ACTN|nr:SpoIIE family protein phosphatase [Streptomyces sp. DSM 42041]MDT0381762.1 SpoIIE family protein phosphatase [Streptomyces sp. DSM 42041]